MTLDIDMAEIAQLFIEESMEGLDVMESELLKLQPGAANPETMNTIFRAAHSIKGGGAAFGFAEISEFAHHVETLLDEMRQGQHSVTQEAVDLLLQSVDCIRDMISSLGDADVEVDTNRAGELEVQLEKMLRNAEPVVSVAANISQNNSQDSSTGTSDADIQPPNCWGIQFKPLPGILKSCNDPLRIFRELASLGELVVHAQGADKLEFDNLDPENCLLSWQLELRGDATPAQIEEVFAWVQDECELRLDPIFDGRDEDQSIGNSAGSDLGETRNPQIHPVEKVVTPGKSAARRSGANQETSSIRVNIDKVDALINLVGELVITQSMLSRFGGDFDFTQLHSLREGLSQLSRNTRELQESVMAIRMLPISFAFNRFPRLVRDVGNALGKKVELRVSGENTELDKTVLEKIGDPLVHLVRNSLDHGLETPEIRKAAGKPETGMLELNAYHESGNIVIEIIDDGAGINKEKVLSKARERGLVGPDEDLSDERITNLIFMPGFSTVDTISDLSGRGVGMDVVQRNVADLGGHVAAHSVAGKGSKFTICLPLTLAILDGQLVRVGKETYIISLLSIVETIQIGSESVNEIAGKTELFKLRDEYLPVVRLHELFGIEADSRNITDGLLVVAEANGQRIGIFVDDLLQQQQVVIKSLESNYQQMLGISGATILGDGTVALIMDVPGLIQLFFNKGGDQNLPTASIA